MANYFVNGNKFVPPKNETGLPILDEITGLLVAYDKRTGNNSSGYWIIIRIKTVDDYINVFFEPDNVDSSTMGLLEMLNNKSLRLQCQNGKPLISICDADIRSVRAGLLKGVAAGHIKTEDLPALLEFYNGNDETFEKWTLFKKQLDNEGLNNVKNQVAEEISQLQIKIEQEKRNLNELKDVYSNVVREKESLLKELNSALLLLQGEEHLQGTYDYYLNGDSEEMVPIGSGYNSLVSAFNKAGTRKGIFVICNNQIHQIHHVFLEEKGRAFLLGTQREYLKASPEKVKEIIDKLEGIKNNPIQCL